MKNVAIVAMLVAAGTLVGCEPAEPKTQSDRINAAEVDGLEVTLEVPRKQYSPGEKMNLTVVARNTTERDMRIEANTGAPVYVRVWRHTGLGWTQVHRYPEMTTMVMNPWTLDAESRRTFPMNITVEPDWPTGERLRLTAELNGRAKAQPEVMIHVTPPAGSSSRPAQK
jgi:hypothetical protein